MKHEPESWVKAYSDDGFVIVEDLLDAETLKSLRGSLEGITENLDGLAPPLKEKIFLERQHVVNNPQWYEGVLSPEECGQAVRQIDDLGLFEEKFAELICYRPLLDVLEALFGSTEFSFTSLIGRPKAARVGNGISNGNFHRDTPFEDFTHANTIVVILCLDEMTGTNGATMFIRGSHKVSEEEARKPCWREVEAATFNSHEKVAAHCPAGSAIFFNTKILHAAGHNRSDQSRNTILVEWMGPNVLPTSPVRHAYQGLRPRSKDPAFHLQARMTFPKLFAGRS